MTQVLIAAAVVVVAVAAAAVLRRRGRTDAPAQSRTWSVPAQLDRTEFSSPCSPWLVAVFSSESCEACAGTVEKARVLESFDVAVDDVSWQTRPETHRRYHIEATPITVIADSIGVVRASFVGPMSATDLWAAVAELREPGSSPEPHLGRS